MNILLEEWGVLRREKRTCKHLYLANKQTKNKRERNFKVINLKPKQRNGGKQTILED